MKDSHYRTPRTLSECHFVPGYKSAESRSAWDAVEEAGHAVLGLLSVAGLAVLVVFVVLGVL